VLQDLRERLEAFQVLLRIGKEVKAFSRFESYAQAAELAVALSRQNEGWIKGQARQRQGDVILTLGQAWPGCPSRANWSVALRDNSCLFR